jgi:outer membrane protein assembly factor BamB
MRILLPLLALFPLAADWPQFRGPNGSGVSAEKNLPIVFTKTEGVRWKVDLPARGVSSPVVVADKVFVTCSSGVRDDRLHLLAFDVATGKKLWHRQLAATGGTAAHPKTCMAAPTPVADANAVYALFATGDMVAFDHSGKLLWYRSLTGDYPTISNQVGMAASPVLFQGKLIVPMDNAGDSFLAAIDVANGKNLWKTERPRDINWVTPAIREITSDETEVIFQGPKDLVAYDLATGKKKWSHKVGGSSPTPSLAEGMLFVSSGGLSAFKPGDGKLEEVWKSPKFQTGYSSALFYDGRIYAANPSSGIVYCADAKTGKVLWEERMKGMGKPTFSASPVAGDGKVYILSETGTLNVLKAGDESDVLGTSEISEECLATPAIAGGAVIVRTDKSLWCIGGKK